MHAICQNEIYRAKSQELIKQLSQIKHKVETWQRLMMCFICVHYVYLGNNCIIWTHYVTIVRTKMFTLEVSVLYEHIMFHKIRLWCVIRVHNVHLESKMPLYSCFPVIEGELYLSGHRWPSHFLLSHSHCQTN